jgi:hypothetical protein
MSEVKLIRIKIGSRNMQGQINVSLETIGVDPETISALRANINSAMSRNAAKMQWRDSNELQLLLAADVTVAEFKAWLSVSLDFSRMGVIIVKGHNSDQIEDLAVSFGQEASSSPPRAQASTLRNLM